jgi:hypothetical protein
MIQDNSDDFEDKPKLQLETAGAGSGRNRKTAIGAMDWNDFHFHFHFDRAGLADPPWWFLLHGIFLRAQYKRKFRRLPLEQAMAVLESANVPPLYKLGLGLRWGFITAGFSAEDFGYLTRPETAPSERMMRHTSRDLDAVEIRSTYQIWIQTGSILTIN